ncbi:putative tyrosine-protein phosphatase [Porphyridium purpureum]|uniref:Putative tyrosine-protein phosphatase n=1 Tax=Porphyridium purpureum TaxID=35688 RepID=A0A5J4YWH5_PORPP|nr:putative tyrosine-protein phosphatase [Porphyridium purpureum]|eukprot:POR8338..scf209_3
MVMATPRGGIGPSAPEKTVVGSMSSLPSQAPQKEIPKVIAQLAPSAGSSSAGAVSSAASASASVADTSDLLEESFTPPEYFGIVECGVYRSNLPNPISFPFIKLLKIKTVLLLSADVPTKLVRTFFEENSFTVHHLGLESSKVDADSWKPLSDELVKDALELALDARTHPVLLCDASGMHQIGTVIGCLRRLQLWSLNAAVSEYRSYAGVKTRYQYEQFIELFDVDLITLPLHVPKWFKQYLEMEEEELAQLQEMLAAGLMKPGSLVLRDDIDVPKYRKYYYSDSIPLNSEEQVPKPRIQQLP